MASLDVHRRTSKNMQTQWSWLASLRYRWTAASTLRPSDAYEWFYGRCRVSSADQRWSYGISVDDDIDWCLQGRMGATMNETPPITEWAAWKVRACSLIYSSIKRIRLHIQHRYIGDVFMTSHLSHSKSNIYSKWVRLLKCKTSIESDSISSWQTVSEYCVTGIRDWIFFIMTRSRSERFQFLCHLFIQQQNEIFCASLEWSSGMRDRFIEFMRIVHCDGLHSHKSAVFSVVILTKLKPIHS